MFTLLEELEPMTEAVLRSQSRLEPPLLGRLRCWRWFFCLSEPRAGAAFLRRLRIRLHLLGKQKRKPCSCVKKSCSNNFLHSIWQILVYGAGAAWSRLFCLEPEPIWSEPEPVSDPEPQTSGAGAAQKSGGSATLSSGSTPPVPRKKSSLRYCW